jgi:hypothetical protein
LDQNFVAVAKLKLQCDSHKDWLDSDTSTIAEEVISVVSRNPIDLRVRAIILIPDRCLCPSIRFEALYFDIKIELHKLIDIDFVLERELCFNVGLQFDCPVLILSWHTWLSRRN